MAGKRFLLLILICITVIIINIRIIGNYEQESEPKASKTKLDNVEKTVESKNQSDKIKKHIFIDLGANNGDSIKMFLKIKSYSMRETIKEYTTENKSWHIYAVEANPYFNEMLKETKIYCENLGHTFYLLSETAASNKNEKVVFYLDPNGKRWGSSLIGEHPDVQSGQNVTVNGVDVSDILKMYNLNDEIVMKVDIEGAEYTVLPHLINNRAINLVDRIVVEFHPNAVKGAVKDPQKIQASFYEYCSKNNIKNAVWWD